MSTILCDVDGVVADLLTEWLNRYNAEWEDALTPDQITAWEMHPFVKPECGAGIYGYLHAPDLYDAVEAVPGALEGVRHLRADGHRVVFLTACVGPEMAAAKIRWLHRHGFIDSAIHKGMRDVVIAQSKELVRGDMLIDDYPENLRTFPGSRVLLTAPYNAQHHDGYYRAESWADVPWIVRGIFAAAA